MGSISVQGICSICSNFVWPYQVGRGPPSFCQSIIPSEGSEINPFSKIYIYIYLYIYIYMYLYIYIYIFFLYTHNYLYIYVNNPTWKLLSGIPSEVIPHHKKIILGPLTDPATPRHISSRCRDQLACSVASHKLTIGVIANLRYRYPAKK